MDRNLILAFALSMAVFAAWVAWQESVVAPQREAAAQRAAEARGETTDDAVAGSERAAPSGSSASSSAGSEATRATEPASAAQEPGPSDPAGPGPLAEMPVVAPWQGDLASAAVRARLSNRGGTLIGWQLLDYFETTREEVPVQVLDLHPGDPRTLETPFDDLGAGDLADALYEVEHADAESVSFVLRRGGVEIRKVYARPSDDYTMDVRIDVHNATGRVLEPRFEMLVPAATNDREDFREISLVALAAAEVTREPVPGIGSPGFFDRILGSGDDGPITLPADLAWAGLDLRYFAGVVMPESRAEAGVTFLPIEKGRSAVARLWLSGVEVAPGETVSRHFTAFIGPKRPDLLARVGDDLEQVISRGGSWVSPLTGFFEWALHWVHGFVPNYGLAIIVLTILVRLATWPIMARQMKSAERMRELMPRVKALQEKHKDDRQKLSEETFKLYRETGVNPLGGCLPMLLQLPVFIGLFYALQSSIDLRHAPFFGWIDDLSAPATLFTLPGVDFPVRVLPILMGASMYVQQKMMPQAGMDPAQAKMMLIMMPGMMLVISYTFPSGLVLYWMVSNLLGIAHQLFVRSRMHASKESG